MQVINSKADGLKREYRISVPATAIAEKVDGRLKELARTMRMPGFRPGKVPVALLRKRFGTAVRGEALEQAVDDATKRLLSDHGLRPANQPQISDVKTEEDADLEYTLAVEVLPEVTVPDYRSIAIERLVVEADSGEVDQALDRLAAAHGHAQSLSEPRPAAAGDTVVIDFVGRVDGEVFPGGTAEGYELALGSNMFIPGFEDQLIGAEVGEERDVTVSFPKDYGAEHLAGKEAVFSVKINDIRTVAPAPLDDELAKKIGKESLDDLKTAIVDHQQQELRQLSRLQAKRALLDQLAELYAFDVPVSMVDREYEGIIREVVAEHQQSTASDTDHEHSHDEAHDHDHDQAPSDAGLSPEDRAEYRRIAERRVRLGLVLAEVGRTNGLQVTADELRRAMVAEARRHPGQEQAVLQFFEKNPQAGEVLAGPILEDKVVDFMLELASVTERIVELEELKRSLEDDSGGATSARQPDSTLEPKAGAVTDTDVTPSPDSESPDPDSLASDSKVQQAPQASGSQ